jgi:hypothetical protein
MFEFNIGVAGTVHYGYFGKKMLGIMSVGIFGIVRPKLLIGG